MEAKQASESSVSEVPPVVDSGVGPDEDEESLKVVVTDFEEKGCGSGKDDTVTLWQFKLTYGEPATTVGVTSILPLGLMEEALFDEVGDIKQLKGSWTIFVHSKEQKVIKEARAIAKELYYHHGLGLAQEVSDFLDDEHENPSVRFVGSDGRNFQRSRVLFPWMADITKPPTFSSGLVGIPS